MQGVPGARFCLLTLACRLCDTGYLCFFLCQTPPNTPAPVHSTVSHRLMNTDTLQREVHRDGPRHTVHRTGRPGVCCTAVLGRVGSRCASCQQARRNPVFGESPSRRSRFPRLCYSPKPSSSYLLSPSPQHLNRPPTRVPLHLSPLSLPALHPLPLASPTFFPSVLHPRPSPPLPPGPAPSRRPRPAGGHGVDGRSAAVAAPPVTWSRDALQHGGAVGPRRRFLTGRRGRTRPVLAGTPSPQRLSPACSHRPPAGLPAPAGPGPCRRARPRACSCPGPWRRS